MLIRRIFRPTLLNCFLLFPVYSVVISCSSTPPPYEEITRSSYVIEEAQEDGAQTHAPLELRQAHQTLEKAQQALKDERYEEARNFASIAEIEAELAKSKTEAIKNKQAAEDIQESILVLKQESLRYQSVKQ
ncbi:MAG: DUF4398 domain-containing protein [Methylicorpusculum sp.]|uniref:DUF4398 domain-containing protein n=1 Tax=Methylicorpusculum sp. TaxID=2713644 RepID=UPI002715D0B2|nr:DUF4398 domain-containing protein [Methylicorpusculum sp.]MDO8844294.1 DUF4398 domain-containing protein [Methylicorpusculum sp.]MDO8939863.1 DUF4398 domain-containing protein [Methylicorpusculum sp.]MDP2178784.1 DUF4398 domain-containing protein [Methylicorpusculum sp.]MDP2202498.1 DUF4398 domain-containing protein [Methylicorpusculum sp.]MDP3530371.1 DUF4398 domain-containing protein [Methylicorpusculum sp.]